MAGVWSAQMSDSMLSTCHFTMNPSSNRDVTTDPRAFVALDA
jgi:hypothetical protein